MKNNNEEKKKSLYGHNSQQEYKTGNYCRDDYDTEIVRESISALMGNGIKLHSGIRNVIRIGG